jgi:integrase
MHDGKRYRMPVDDFAFARGASALITSKQEAEKVWEPKFIAEIASGKDPRVVPGRETAPGKPTTVAELFSLYRQRYVEVERLKSRHTALSQLRVLTSELGQLPAKALERPDAIEDFKARCSGRAIAITNRYLARLRHVCNWAIGRELLNATPFHRRGLRIITKNEQRRDRRITEAEEQQLLDACKLLNELPRANAKLSWEVVQNIRTRAQSGVAQRELASTFNIPQSLCSDILSGKIWDPDARLTTGDEMRDRIIGALDTGCRCGEMMKIQNKHVDWQHRWIHILKENSKTEVARVIPFDRGSRLEEVLRRRAFLGPDAYVFGHAKTGEHVGSFRSAWATLLLLSHGVEPAPRSRGQRRREREAIAKINLHARPAPRGTVTSC